VADRRVEQLLGRKKAVQRENRPRRLVVLHLPPVERGLPAFRSDRVPAVGEPEIGFRVAAVFDEGEVLAAGDERGRELEGSDILQVPGGLVIERKSGFCFRFSGVADGNQL